MNSSLKPTLLLSLVVPLLCVNVGVYGAESKEDNSPSISESVNFFNDLKVSRIGFNKGRTKQAAIEHGKNLVTGYKTALTQRDGASSQLRDVQQQLQQNEICKQKVQSLEKKLSDAQQGLAALQRSETVLDEANRDTADLRGQIDQQRTLIDNLTREKNKAIADLDRFQNISDDLAKKNQELAETEAKLAQAETNLNNCRKRQLGQLPLTYTQQAIKAASLIAFKDQINQVANLSPCSAPTVLGISVGSSRQVSEVVGHTLQAVYDKNQELNQFCKDDMKDIGAVAVKTFARELALSTLCRVGEKTGINGKVVNVYQNSRVPEFLEKHTTTKAVVESASRLTVGALRLGTDVVLENLVWSNLPSGNKK